MKQRYRLTWNGILISILALLTSLGALCITHKSIAKPAATTITVTSNSSGTGGPECKLRDAISAANLSAVVGGCDGSAGGPFIIELQSPSYLFTEIDNHENGLPIIASDITIDGNRAILERSPAGSTPDFRLFQVALTGTLTLNNVTVRNGSGVSEGGGLDNSGYTHIQNSSFIYNYANDGAGINNHETGRLEISQSRFVYNYGGCGGAIQNNGLLTMTETVLIANTGYN